MAFFGQQAETVELELFFGLGLPDSAEAFQVGLETLEKILVGVFWFEIVGVEVLKMGNRRLIAVVIDARPPVNKLFWLFNDSELDE